MLHKKTVQRVFLPDAEPRMSGQCEDEPDIRKYNFSGGVIFFDGIFMRNRMKKLLMGCIATIAISSAVCPSEAVAGKPKIGCAPWFSVCFTDEYVIILGLAVSAQ